MIKETKICENIIEGIRICLYTNGDKYSHQNIEVANIKTGKAVKSRNIAPVDFYAITTGIMNNDRLCDVLEDFSDTWSFGSLEAMIEIAVESEGEL